MKSCGPKNSGPKNRDEGAPERKEKMTKPLVTLVIALILVPFLGCSEWGGGLPDTEVARVNQDPITAG